MRRSTLTPLASFTALLITLAGAGTQSVITASPAAAATPTIVIEAHRAAPDTGGSELPQNSLSAVKRAVAAGVKYVEVDVQTTIDGKFVIRHDDRFPTSQTAADNAGVDYCPSAAGQYAHNFTYSQIQQVKCDGENVTTLYRVIQAVKGHKATDGTPIVLNLEIKSWNTTLTQDYDDSTLQPTTAQLKKVRGMSGEDFEGYAKKIITYAYNQLGADQLVVSSFVWRHVAPAAASVDSAIEVIGFQRGQKSSEFVAKATEAAAAGVDGYGMALGSVASNSDLKAVQDLGLYLRLFSVTDDDLTRVINQGQRVIGTDDVTGTCTALAKLGYDAVGC